MSRNEGRVLDDGALDGVGAGAALPTAARAWIVLVCSAGLMGIGWVLLTDDRSPPLEPWLLYTIAVAVGTVEWPLHRLNRALGVVEPWVFLGPLVVWTLGTRATLLAASIAMLGALAVGRRPPHRWPFNVAVRCLAVVGSSSVMAASVGSSAPRPPAEVATTRGLVAYVVAVVVWWLIPWVCVSVIRALAGGRQLRSELGGGWAIDLGAAVLFSSVGPIVLLALAFQPWLLPLLVLPVLGSLSNANRAQLHHLEARTDALCGLPNRLAIHEAIADGVRANAGRGRRFAVCMLDLDGFKGINDELGHAAGDRVLEQLSRRLTRQTSDRVLIGRLGGDEFTVVWLDDADRDEYERRSEQVRALVRGPLDVDGVELRLGAALGLAVHPDDGDDVSSLLRHADEEMYREKRERSTMPTAPLGDHGRDPARSGSERRDPAAATAPPGTPAVNGGEHAGGDHPLTTIAR
jgi:diguanylate cyclase (GGDEF)-like protein